MTVSFSIKQSKPNLERLICRQMITKDKLATMKSSELKKLTNFKNGSKLNLYIKFVEESPEYHASDLGQSPIVHLEMRACLVSSSCHSSYGLDSRCLHLNNFHKDVAFARQTYLFVIL